MNSKEINEQLEMNYTELVDYLLKKYGKAKYDYFCNELCKSKNKKVSRTNEGLFCHHIDEDKSILLSNDKFAIQSPFEYQKADRLVYCNILEHLILHIKIVEEPKQTNYQGIGGAVCIICPQINDFFNGYIFKQQYLNTCFNLIKNNFDDYINVLKYFLKFIEQNASYKKYITKKNLSVGYNGQIIKKIYDLL